MKDRTKSRTRPTEQEYEAARDIGGKRQRASGAMQNDKGDAISEYELVDCKTTKRSFTLSADEVLKHTGHSMRKGLVPVFQIELRDLPTNRQKWAVLPWDEYLELRDNR